MPKSGTRKGCKTQSGGGFKPADETSLEKGRRLNIIIAGVVAILAVAVAFYWWDLGETKREFLVLDLKGKGALSQVTNEKSLGGAPQARSNADLYKPVPDLWISSSDTDRARLL